MATTMSTAKQVKNAADRAASDLSIYKGRLREMKTITWEGGFRHRKAQNKMLAKAALSKAKTDCRAAEKGSYRLGEEATVKAAIRDLKKSIRGLEDLVEKFKAAKFKAKLR